MNYIKGITSCFCIIAFFTLLACHNLENDKVEVVLSKIENNTLFRIDSIETKSWDTLCIIRPYELLTNVTDVDFSIKERKMVEDLTRFDGHCTLLFVKDRRIISYTVISRDIADFSTLDKVYFRSNQIFRITNQRQVIGV